MRAVIALVAVALFSAGASRLLAPASKLVTLDVIETTAIQDSRSTIGIADSQMLFDTPADINRALDEMQALGVQTVRIAIPWAAVEPLEGQFDWSKIDTMVNAAAARGMGVLGVLNHTPAWAGSYLNGHPDPAEYADYAATVARRYGEKVSAYEIWNEPNWALSWNPVSPEAYTELLKAAYTSIKEVADDLHTDITVVGGVLGSGISIGDFTMDPVTFAQRMYAAGAKGYFDALSFHPYQYSTKFSEGALPYPWNATSPINQLYAIRDVMEQYLDTLKSDGTLKTIWISEYGEPTGQYPDGTNFTDTNQAEYIADMLNTWQTIAFGGPIFVYTTRDRATGSANYDDNFGIFTTDWTPKSAAEVIRKIIEQLGGTEPSVPPGTGAIDPISMFVQLIVNSIQSVVGAITGMVSSITNFVASMVTGFLGMFTGGATAAAASPQSALTLAASTGDPANAVEPGARLAAGADADAKAATDAEVKAAADAEVSTPAGAEDVSPTENLQTTESVVAIEPAASPEGAEPATTTAPAELSAVTTSSTEGLQSEKLSTSTVDASPDQTKKTDAPDATTAATGKEPEDGSAAKDADRDDAENKDGDKKNSTFAGNKRAPDAVRRSTAGSEVNVKPCDEPAKTDPAGSTQRTASETGANAAGSES